MSLDELTSLRRRTCVSRVAGTAGSYTLQHHGTTEKYNTEVYTSTISGEESKINDPEGPQSLPPPWTPTTPPLWSKSPWRVLYPGPSVLPCRFWLTCPVSRQSSEAQNSPPFKKLIKVFLSLLDIILSPGLLLLNVLLLFMELSDHFPHLSVVY